MSGQPRSPSATYIATDHNKATIRMDEVNSTMLNISASESHSHKGQTALIALFVFVSIIGITGKIQWLKIGSVLLSSQTKGF